MFDLQAQRDMNKGFGDGLTRAVELAITPLVFGALGFVIDRTLDATPVFTVLLAAVALVGMVVRFWYGYDHEMKGHEANASWNRSETPVAASEPVDLWGDGDKEVSV